MTAAAYLGGLEAAELVDVTNDPSALDSSGWWAVVVTFEGTVTCARFANVRARTASVQGRWLGPPAGAWTSSMSQPMYTGSVDTVRELIARGDVYQANVCRLLQARLPDPEQADVSALASVLSVGNPAPYSGYIRLPADAHPLLPPGGVHIATASPEQFIRRDGDYIESSPIKGTGRTAADLLPKDEAENIMIVDLVRNDLSPVCQVGSVEVPSLLRIEEHPGLVHLVSTVSGRLIPGLGWADMFASAFPPGSVTGAPKVSALRIIRELEPVDRGPYCGAIGWVDADRKVGELAVGIRTFWLAGAATRRDRHPLVRFGTGAGITWGSDPEREWDETELKASRLVGLASRTVDGPAIGSVR